MKKPDFWKLSTIMLIIIMGISITLMLTAQRRNKVDQPRMYQTLGLLYMAKDTLEKAARNKGGHRVKAIRKINRAIRNVKAGIRHAQSKRKNKRWQKKNDEDYTDEETYDDEENYDDEETYDDKDDSKEKEVHDENMSTEKDSKTTRERLREKIKKNRP